MSWKNYPYWLRGAIISTALMLIGLVFFSEWISIIPATILPLTIWNIPLLGMLVLSIFYFILGAIVGWIIGKFRKKPEEKEKKKSKVVQGIIFIIILIGIVTFQRLFGSIFNVFWIDLAINIALVIILIFTAYFLFVDRKNKLTNLGKKIMLIGFILGILTIPVTLFVLCGNGCGFEGLGYMMIGFGIGIIVMLIGAIITLIGIIRLLRITN